MKTFKTITTNMLAKRLPIYVLMAMLLVHVSCSKDDEGALDPATGVIGSWKLKSFSTTSTKEDVVEYLKLLNASIKISGYVKELELKKDKTGTGKEIQSKGKKPVIHKFKWEIKDKVLTLTYSTKEVESVTISKVTSKELTYDTKTKLLLFDKTLYPITHHYEKK